MRSWIFRHRLRLRAIYGPLPPAVAPARKAPNLPAKGRAQGLEPGECERRGRFFVVRPMPPPAA